MNGELFYQRYLMRIRWFLLISTVLISALFMVLLSDSAKFFLNVAGIPDVILNDGLSGDDVELDHGLVVALKAHAERQLIRIGILEEGKGLERDRGAAKNPGSLALKQLQSKLQFYPTYPTFSQLFIVDHDDVRKWIMDTQKMRLSILRGEIPDDWDARNFTVSNLVSLEEDLRKIYYYDLSLRKAFRQRYHASTFITIVVCWLGGLFVVSGLQVWCLRGPAFRYMLNEADPTIDEIKKLKRVEMFLPWMASALAVYLASIVFMREYDLNGTYELLILSMYSPFILLGFCIINLYYDNFMRLMISFIKID